jgi:hypothetical protein
MRRLRQPAVTADLRQAAVDDWLNRVVICCRLTTFVAKRVFGDTIHKLFVLLGLRVAFGATILSRHLSIVGYWLLPPLGNAERSAARRG